MPERRAEVLHALEGDAVEPPVTGLSYVPVATLSGLAGTEEDPAEVLVAAVEGLGLDFAFVPSAEPWARRAVRLLDERGLYAFWSVDGPLWRVLRSFGLEEGLRLTRWDPERLEPRLDAETSRAGEEVARGAETGAHAVVIADDLASSKGPLIAPDYLNAHVIRRLALIVATAAAHGTRCAFHSDGDVRAFLQSLTRAGFVSLHGGGGLDEDAFDRLFAQVRARGLTFVGGMHTESMQALPSAVALGTRMGVRAAAGGLLLCDDGGLTTAEEVAALSAGLAAARGDTEESE